MNGQTKENRLVSVGTGVFLTVMAAVGTPVVVVVVVAAARNRTCCRAGGLAAGCRRCCSASTRVVVVWVRLMVTEKKFKSVGQNKEREGRG